MQGIWNQTKALSMCVRVATATVGNLLNIQSHTVVNMKEKLGRQKEGRKGNGKKILSSNPPLNTQKAFFTFSELICLDFVSFNSGHVPHPTFLSSVLFGLMTTTPVSKAVEYIKLISLDFKIYYIQDEPEG